MRLVKRILAHSATQDAVARIAALYVRLVFVTTRWEWRGFEAADRIAASGQGHIVCFWHGRLLMMSCYRRRLLRGERELHRRIRHAAMISNHRDGQLIARAIAHLGIDTIAGSSTRGGLAALLAAVGALERGAALAVTPDGPRGPRMHAAAGAIYMARNAGVPIFPATVSVTRRRLLSSWDRFLVPLPFGRGVFILDEPLTVAPSADPDEIERARDILETRLNAITAAADRLTGHAPLEPERIGDAPSRPG